MDKQYALIDSGDQNKLERFGKYLIIRPCSQAMWQPKMSAEAWKKADALFTRDSGNQWKGSNTLPPSWIVELEGIQFKLSATDFGHLGIFPEHALFWQWMAPLIRNQKREVRILNLFAYSGGATLAAAKAGAKVCHLDASKGMVAWARENAALNGLKDAPIRWIVDDALKFLKREAKRNSRYDAIILDPPTFGRGNRGEVFKIERDLNELLSLCRGVLSEDPLFVLLSSHTPGMTPVVMRHLMDQMMDGKKGRCEAEELVLPAEKGRDVPCGSYAKWTGLDLLLT